MSCYGRPRSRLRARSTPRPIPIWRTPKITCSAPSKSSGGWSAIPSGQSSRRNNRPAISREIHVWIRDAHTAALVCRWRSTFGEIMSQPAKNLLLTAFEPFGGESLNSSREAARAFAGVEFSDADLTVMELPVDRHRAVELASERIRTLRPDAVIMLDEPPGRFPVSP